MNAVTPSTKRSLKAGKSAKRKTTQKSSNRHRHFPKWLSKGKRTIDQLTTEINFANAVAGGQLDALAAQVRQMKKDGKLVDCSV